jgi:hypothetical protein
MPLHRSRQITIGIARPLDVVYPFLAKPENFARWASGLGDGLKPLANGNWHAESPNGPVEIHFSHGNEYGILDHTIMAPDGATVYVPMRAYGNGDGTEIVLTLFRLPHMTSEEFERDAEWVNRDLLALKTLLED